jgi:hypothetical protein
MKTIASVLILALISLFFIKNSQPTPQSASMPDLTKGKTVVQLNYEWNKSKTYKWVNTPSVKYHYLSLDKFPPQVKDQLKVKAVPTIIVFNNGKEIKRFDGGMMMEIKVPQSEILK